MWKVVQVWELHRLTFCTLLKCLNHSWHCFWLIQSSLYAWLNNLNISVKFLPTFQQNFTHRHTGCSSCFIVTLSLIQWKDCARAKFNGYSSMTNDHSETGQMAVCCQNLTLGVLSSCSALSVLDDTLFKLFGLFLNMHHSYKDFHTAIYRRSERNHYTTCMLWSLKTAKVQEGFIQSSFMMEYKVPKGQDLSLIKRKVPGRLFCMLPCLLLHLSLIKAILVYTWLPSKFRYYIYHSAGNTHQHSKPCFIYINPLTPELNPSAQCCLTWIFYWEFCFLNHVFR
jgi:hypothetical protein